ncbi:MAG: nucleotide-binding domain containing protein, partial [Bacteroidota bacterium]
AATALTAIGPALDAGEPFLVYSTAEPAQVATVQAKLGAERAATLVEDALALVAEQIVARGVRRLVVAGGETSGAVVKALRVKALAIGPQIDPGVPWTISVGSKPRIALALKSGNFGAPDFFAKALELMP